MPSSGSYSRVYHSVKDDERFATVYASDENFATWVRLLIEADASFPASAPIPRSCRQRPLTALVRAGLVDLHPNHLYRIHGMQTEREQRSEAGRAGGIASGRSRTPKDLVERPLNDSLNEENEQNEQVKTRRDETSKDETSKAGNAPGDLFRLVEKLTNRTFGFSPGSRPWQMLTDDVKAVGAEKVEAAYRAVAADADGPLDAAGVIYGGHKHLFPIPDGPRKLSTTERKQAEKAALAAEWKAS